MCIIDNGGVRIHYRTYGEREQKDALVFLCGAGTDHTIWRAQIDDLKRDHFVISIDNRGSGESDCPDGPYTAEEMAADVLAVIDAEYLASVNLIGFSLGGLLAQKFVGCYPQRVKRLVLMNCSLGAGNPDTVLPGKEIINMFLFFAALTREDRCRNSVDYCFGKSLKTEDPETYQAFFDYTFKNSLGIPAQIPILVSNERFIADFERVRMPVLVVISTDDPLTPPENGAAFNRHLPHARVEYLDGYHASMLIHPIEVTALLRDFLSSD